MIIYVVQHVIWHREPGLDLQDYAQRELFDQLGIPASSYFWQRDRAGNTEGYSQLFLRPLEFGRLGQLWLTDGVYQGRRSDSSSGSTAAEIAASGRKLNCCAGTTAR